MVDPGFAGGKLITCILPKDHAIPLMKKLHKEKGVTAMSVHHARGAGRSGLTRHGMGHYVENNILTIAVSSEEADDIFNFVFTQAGINADHRGLIFMEKLARMTPYILPEGLKKE
jgi:nitrogen regulatory protein PII